MAGLGTRCLRRGPSLEAGLDVEPVPAAAAAILPPTGQLSGNGTCATTAHPPFVLSPRPARQYPRITSSAGSASLALVVRAACRLRPRRRAGRRVWRGLGRGSSPLDHVVRSGHASFLPAFFRVNEQFRLRHSPRIPGSPGACKHPKIVGAAPKRRGTCPCPVLVPP